MPAGTTVAGSLVYGGLAAATLAAGRCFGQTIGTPNEMLFQFGALGLCGFMVYRNYKAQERMGRVIDAQHEEFVKLAQRTIGTIDKNTAAMDACIARQKKEF
jgi:cyanophycinase-like exopeptidase